MIKGQTSEFVYELSALEEYTIGLMARSRQENKEKNNIKSKRFDNRRSDLQIHLMGMRAEYAVAACLGALPRWELSLGGDSNGGDIVLRDGRTCSVKYRNRRGWDFALQSGDPAHFREDLGVLVYPAGSRHGLLLHGWVTREYFIENVSFADYGYGNRAMISPGQMTDFGSLFSQTSEEKSYMC